MPIRPTLQIAAGDAEALLASGLVGVNLKQMQRLRPAGAPSVFDLIRSGRLYYSRLDPEEQWQTYEQVVERVWAEGRADADCEDLASMIAAEYRYTGIDPGATVTVYPSAPGVSHVVVRLSSGQLQDPSIAAGMGTPEQRARDAETAASQVMGLPVWR